MVLRRDLLVGTIALVFGLVGPGLVDPRVVGADDPVAIAPAVIAPSPPAVIAPSAPAALDEDLGDDSGRGGLAPVLGGLVVLGAVLAIGLAAIRRQRAEGRRSKFPPIG